MPIPDRAISEMSEMYGSLVFQEVLKAPFVNGMPDFLNEMHKYYQLYIVTGTPDSEINKIATNYNYECSRWYDKNVDLFTSFEIIKNLNPQRQNVVAKKIIETIMFMYFEGASQANG